MVPDGPMQKPGFEHFRTSSQPGRGTGIRLKPRTAEFAGIRGTKKQENFTKTLPFLYQKFVFGHLSVPGRFLKRVKVQPRARSSMKCLIVSDVGIHNQFLGKTTKGGLDKYGPT
jgi:hypothetical protein